MQGSRYNSLTEGLDRQQGAASELDPNVHSLIDLHGIRDSLGWEADKLETMACSAQYPGGLLGLPRGVRSGMESRVSRFATGGVPCGVKGRSTWRVINGRVVRSGTSKLAWPAFSWEGSRRVTKSNCC